MQGNVKKTSLFATCLLAASVFLAGSFAQPAAAQPADTGNEAASCNATFLGFPAWYRGIAEGAECEIKSPTEFGGIGDFIWIIVLNIVELLLRAAGFAAVAYIIYGGYKYMISAGSPDGMVAARKTIMNAVIGLVISIAAVAIVNTIAGRFLE